MGNPAQEPYLQKSFIHMTCYCQLFCLRCEESEISKIEDAQSLLTLVVNAAKSVGLNINEDKTEYMTINIPNNTELQANGKTLNRVDNFKYLGSWVENTSKDLKIRKGQA